MLSKTHVLEIILSCGHFSSPFFVLTCLFLQLALIRLLLDVLESVRWPLETAFLIDIFRRCLPVLRVGTRVVLSGLFPTTGFYKQQLTYSEKQMNKQIKKTPLTRDHPQLYTVYVCVFDIDIKEKNGCLFCNKNSSVVFKNLHYKTGVLFGVI